MAGRYFQRNTLSFGKSTVREDVYEFAPFCFLSSIAPRVRHRNGTRRRSACRASDCHLRFFRLSHYTESRWCDSVRDSDTLVTKFLAYRGRIGAVWGFGVVGAISARQVSPADVYSWRSFIGTMHIGSGHAGDVIPGI
jgi:hypothetical protein